MSYYAVSKGIKTGIYSTWNQCQQQTKGFSGAKFKKFKSKIEAETWLTQNQVDLEEEKIDYLAKSALHVDGGSNAVTKANGNLEAWGSVVWPYYNRDVLLSADIAKLKEEGFELRHEILKDDIKRMVVIAVSNDVPEQNNNYAELLALELALKLADPSIDTIFCDSTTVLDYWSLGQINPVTKAKMDPVKLKHIESVVRLRKEFKGKIKKIPAASNLADLLWHK